MGAIQPDVIVCIGMRHGGRGGPQDFSTFSGVKQVIAIGSDIANLKNFPGLDLAVLADEGRTVERLAELVLSQPVSRRLDDRRRWAREQVAVLRAERRRAAQSVQHQPSQIRPWVLADALDKALEGLGGGLVMYEQFAVLFDGLGDSAGAGSNVYLQPAGGSEGYGVGGAVGLKLAAPDRPVVGLVGDGSMFYADSGLWTAVHHGVPVLYVIPNNQSYGVVAGAFGRADATMKQTGEYAGVVLDGIDPVKIAEGFGMEGMHVLEESRLDQAIDHGLRVVEGEQRPFLLNVHLPLGLPAGGQAAEPFRLASTVEAKAKVA